MLQKLKDKVNGWKTYLVCVASGITLLVGWAAGEVSDLSFLQSLVGLALVACGRSAVKKVEK